MATLATAAATSADGSVSATVAGLVASVRPDPGAPSEVVRLTCS